MTAVCALGRLGDIISVLPCVRDIALKEGGKCAVVVSEEFASVLEGCSYAEAVVVPYHFTDYLPAVEQAKQMFERVLVAKVNDKSVGISTQCESFNQEAWRQIGFLHRWDDLPLVFDKRSREREQKLKAETLTTEMGRKTVLVNFSGKSAPFPHAQELLFTLFDTPCQILDIGEVKAHRIYDLLGLMDTADLLITGDTSTMHLAAASKVPVVNLIGDFPTRWHGSKPRNNSVLEIRYGEWRERCGELVTLLNSRLASGGC